MSERTRLDIHRAILATSNLPLPVLQPVFDRALTGSREALEQDIKLLVQRDQGERDIEARLPVPARLAGTPWAGPGRNNILRQERECQQLF